MAKLSDWKAYAEQHNGKVVVWINQADALTKGALAAENSAGVCRAITMDWIAADRSFTVRRANFRAQFYGGGMIGGGLQEYCVPKKYLDLQKQLGAEFAKNQITLKALTEKAAKAVAAVEAANEPITLPDGKQVIVPKQGFDRLMAAAQAARDETATFVREKQGGQTCIAFQRFGAIDVVVKALAATTTPGFYALTMVQAGADVGHVVGFELGRFFEFMDANSGLFYFETSADLLTFFTNKIWPGFYSKQGYTIFGLFQYDLGRWRAPALKPIPPPDQKQADVKQPDPKDLLVKAQGQSDSCVIA